jgi:hypothetical protein
VLGHRCHEGIGCLLKGNVPIAGHGRGLAAAYLCLSEAPVNRAKVASYRDRKAAREGE